MWLGAHDRATKGYQAQYEALLAPVRKALPHATCLVISPTDQAEAKNGRYPSKPVIPVLVAAQRKAAAAAGCAFYSTYDWMGGKGSAAKWYRHRLIGSDFVHPSHAGAAKFTDALYDALITGFGRYAGT
jgi:hypothetical protein